MTIRFYSSDPDISSDRLERLGWKRPSSGAVDLDDLTSAQRQALIARLASATAPPKARARVRPATRSPGSVHGFGPRISAWLEESANDIETISVNGTATLNRGGQRSSVSREQLAALIPERVAIDPDPNALGPNLRAWLEQEGAWLEGEGVAPARLGTNHRFGEPISLALGARKVRIR